MDASYSVWTQTSLQKVLKTDKRESLKPAAISAARNEHEAFQIVLRPGRNELRGINVVVTDLVSAGGRIPASNISVYVPAFIDLPKQLAEYPDPLPPLERPIDLNPGQTQPIWVDVFVPKSTRPGDYAGTITIAPSNGKAIEVSYKLHVYNFELPDDPKLATAFGLLPQYIAEQHAVMPDSAEAKALYKEYYEFLLRRGVSAYNIPADILSDEAAKYLKDPRMTSFVIKYTRDEQEQRKILDRVRSLGAWEKGYFYFLDEPVNEKAYNDLKEGCSYLQKIDPKVNIVSPYYTNPDFTKDKSIYELLAGSINIWCCNTGFYEEKNLDARRKTGDKIWNYVCCGPGKPYANFFVSYMPMEHRMLFWQNYFYQVSGLLYWCTTYWQETKDPWTNIATWGGLYGDGSLLYPGKKVGVDGPVSSIRLETIRDGIEDYQYLWLLERKIGREQVMPYVGKLIRSWTEYSTDPALLQSVRNEIAARIEGAR